MVDDLVAVMVAKKVVMMVALMVQELE